MSGPVRPPLEVKESDDSVEVRPTNVISFDSSDFNITKSGTTATITTGGTAGTIGGSITSTQVAFGATTADSIEGSADFTFTADAGSGPVLLLTGENPKIDIQDDTGATDYKTRLVQSGSSLYMFSQDTGGTDTELVRMQPGSVVFNDDGENLDFKIEGQNDDDLFYLDASQDNIGIGAVPDSGVNRLHVQGTSVSTEAIVRIQTESTVAEKDSYGPKIELTRTYSDGNGQDGAELARIKFMGEDDAGNVDCYGDIRMETYDAGAGSEDGVMRFYVTTGGTQTEYIRLTSRDAGSPEQKAVVINEGSGDIGFRVESDGLNPALMVNSGTDNVGIGTDPDSDALLHVKGDGSKTYTVNIESTDTDVSVGPVIRFLRNPGETVQVNDDLGQLAWWGPGGDGSGTPRVYSKILTEVQGVSSGSEHSRVMFKGIVSGSEKEFIRYSASGIELNAFEQDIDTKISSDGVDGLFHLDASQDNIGIGAAPTSGKAQFQVDQDATFTRYLEDNTANIDITAQMCHNTIQTMKSVAGRIYATLPDIDDTVPGMCFTLVSHGGDISLIGKASEGQSINGTAAGATEPTVDMDTTWSRMEVMALTTSFWLVHLNGAIATVTNS